MTKEEIEPFLKEAQIARVCSINKDGSIHAAPVWFKYESGQIIVVTPEASRKVRNVKRNKKQSGTKVFLSGLPSRSASNGNLRSDQVRLV
jgi:nitroimidazol reductase NimA-like FMN-containing flavoprotein (pyridoxamine 5'-phosphate oxidase superfamily)